VAASQDRTARYLILRNDLTNVPSIALLPFQSVSGEFDGKKIEFAPGIDGFRLSKGNELKNLTIVASPDKRAIYQDPDAESLATQHLHRLNVTGQISFVIGSATKKGRIDASFVHIAQASTMHYADRPNRFGVDMVQGALTIWNRSEETVEIEVDIAHYTCGSEAEPVNASGLVIAGAPDEQAGSVKVNFLSTGAIYTKGEIAKGVADLVGAGISVGYNVLVRHINIYGHIVCLGGNEMGIYNWGTIERGSMTDRIETRGSNGCGFINAGIVNRFDFIADIETFGVGARGFYMFDGTIKDIHFNKITTHGDAACGVQFDRYIDVMSFSKGIETFGNAINVLFADTVVKASADAVSLKQGATVRLLKVTGDLVSHGEDVHTISDEAAIEKLLVSGRVVATGAKSVALKVKEGYFGADNTEFTSEQGAAVLIEKAKINNCHGLVAHGKDYDLLIDALSSVDRNIFTKEFLDGIFQPDVRIEYADNVGHPRNVAPEHGDAPSAN
jgi:hypothetical protein